MAKKENTLFENLKESLEEAEKYYKDENKINLKVTNSETLKNLKRHEKLLDHDKVFKDEQ